MSEKEKPTTQRYPMVPIRDVVVFPYMMVPFVIGRDSSVLALERALQTDKKIFLATQKDASQDNPSPDEIFEVGTVANIVQSLKLPDGNIRVMVEGVRRARIGDVRESDGFFQASVNFQEVPRISQAKTSLLTKKLNVLFEQFAKLNPNVNYETIVQASRSTDADRLSDTIASNLPIAVEDKQALLEVFDPAERMEKICEFIEIEIEKIKMDKSIQGRVRRQMEKAQREYYLNEKIKAIQKELGRGEKDEIEELKKKVEESKMPEEAREKALNEIRRLEQMPPMSAESTVSRTYLDWLLAVPWEKRTDEIKDINKAETILEEDHYGLEKVKERILEYLAVRQLADKKEAQGSILCFLGPPGVGKTSLGRSIARATGRKFVRQSLGGVRDEAEIRGHRRTYIGALPGQIIQMMKKAGAKNPVVLLDEIDKMSTDFRGDPSAALMEVLDPEQNSEFNDHYLDVEFDLSEVLFICTANVLHTIPRPLQDRMEIIQISGYTQEEKLNIAQKYLVEKQITQKGLQPEQIEFTDEGISEMIRSYTRESGVRNLEREIANVCRKVARKVVAARSTEEDELEPFKIDENTVRELLGVAKYRNQMAGKANEVGLATGLAWTEVGGEVLMTEATAMRGKGNLTLTGKLGEVMQESVKAAFSYIRSRSGEYGIEADFHKANDMHVHVPEGAIPKDGPSAGIAMATTIVSALTGIPVRRDVAMTGEITLRGNVLPIGGVKEKVLAAHRAGIKTVLLPKENEKNLKDIPDTVKEELEIRLVDSMDEVLEIALERPIGKKSKEDGEKLIEQRPPQIKGEEDRPGVH
ncbi:MAG TPA: endopeptidase La [Acidobacteriota bacterium]|nr:endopeptidase La [Acidobacteriota bacterium]